MDMSFGGGSLSDKIRAVLADSKGPQAVVSRSGRSIYKGIIRWALLIGVFATPLFFLPWTTSVLEMNKQILIMGVAAVGLIAWLLSLVSSGNLSWRVTPFDKGIIAIIVATGAATVFSMARYNSLFGTSNDLASSLASIIAFSIIYFLIVNTFDDQGRRATRWLTISLAVVLLFGLLQLLGLHILKYLNIEIFKFAQSHAFNTVGTVNALGVLAAISLPLFRNRVSVFRYVDVSRIGTILALAILIILNWWVPWAIAIAGMLAYIAYGSINQERFSMSRFVMPMTVIVIGVFLLVVNFNLNIVKKNLPVEVAPSFGLSVEVSKSVLRESMVTGYGPTGFSMAFDKYGAKELAGSTLSGAKFYSGTSEVFNAVVNGGLLMVLALLIVGWSVIQGAIYHLRSRRDVSSDNNAIWAMLIAMAVAFFMYPFNSLLMFVGYVVFALVALSLWGESKRASNIEDNVSLSLTSSLGFIGGLVLVLVGVYFGVSNYIADAKYVSALNDKVIDKAAAKLTDSVNWNSNSDKYYRAASQAALGLLSQEINKPAEQQDAQRTTRIQNYMASAINLAKQATTLAPRETMNWDNLGAVYQNLLGLVEGVDGLAESSYLKASELRPGDASFYNKIGNVHFSKAQLARRQNQAQPATDALAKAEVNFKKAIELSDNYGLAIYNLGAVYEAQGRLPEAIGQLERIAPFNSDQANLIFELGLLYYRNNQKDKAFEAFQRVLIIEPDFANAHWYLSLIYEERKDMANAINEVQKILSVEVNKDNQVVVQRLQQLQKGVPTNPKGIGQRPIQ